MLTMFCFDGLAVVVEDLYFVDPEPTPGQEGPERGVRVELRLVERQPWRGSVYASQRVVVDDAVFRVDLLESVAGGPGNRDRVHHHPAMRDNEPSDRVFDPRLTDDPVGWLEARLADPMGLLAGAGVPDLDLYQQAVAGLRDSLPEITRSVATMLEKVRLGQLATVPGRAA